MTFSELQQKAGPQSEADWKQHKKGHIQIGCHCLTFADWKEKGPALAREHNFTKEEVEEYKAYIALFTKIGK